MFGCIAFLLREEKNKCFLLCDKDGVVMGFKDSLEARAYIEEMYARYMNISRTFTAGALIHMIRVEYRVFNVQDIKDIQALVKTPFSTMEINIDGAVRYGIRLTAKGSKAWYDKGEVVSLPEHSAFVW